jgi:hypothetical protein
MQLADHHDRMSIELRRDLSDDRCRPIRRGCSAQTGRQQGCDSKTYDSVSHGSKSDLHKEHTKKVVMARFMRAIHGNKLDVSMGGPDVSLVLRPRFARFGGAGP